MNISTIKSEGISQYLNLISNPVFLTAMKTAVSKSGDSKYDALLENLEKLSQQINSSNDSSLSSTTSASDKAKDMENALMANMLQGQALDQIINSIIANAENLEALLEELDQFLPPEEELISLLKKFREIISKLEEDTGKIRKEVEKKKMKEKYLLLPSSNTKSGFEDKMQFVANG
jgi:ABC-type transporter Mla subunit MlaD